MVAHRKPTLPCLVCFNINTPRYCAKGTYDPQKSITCNLNALYGFKLQVHQPANFFKEFLILGAFRSSGFWIVNYILVHDALPFFFWSFGSLCVCLDFGRDKSASWDFLSIRFPRSHIGKIGVDGIPPSLRI